jgi:tryptophan synthase alpha chain
MKNRIQKKFQDLQKKKQKAFIGFITAGDPSLSYTPKIVWSLEKAGVDIVELGVPFSDPMADGPVIQKSSERALKSKTSLKGILKAVQEIRKKSEVPILLMGYFNPILQYGVEKFCKDAKNAGVDGVLIVDLPPEEGEKVRRVAKKYQISLIFLLSPTSDKTRIQIVRNKGSGFIYYVSLTGVTGAALLAKRQLKGDLSAVVHQSPLPVCVGFGIKDPQQASQMAQWADGVVVGSAFVSQFEKNSPGVAIKKVSQLAARLAKAVHFVS